MTRTARTGLAILAVIVLYFAVLFIFESQR